MTTQKLPGTDAARHGTGDADLTTLTAAEWRGVGRKIPRSGWLSILLAISAPPPGNIIGFDGPLTRP